MTNKKQHAKILEPTLENLKFCADKIKKGELVAFPTETVYGLGANGLDETACKKIFEAKGRPSDNPLILHISKIEDLKNIIHSFNTKIDTKDIMLMLKELWPGPLTIVGFANDIVPKIVTAGSNTVAVRMPSSNIAKKFIELCQCPIAAPSANKSGSPSPTNSKDVYEDMKYDIDYILDSNEILDIGIESTVLDLTTEEPIILRPGFYGIKELSKYLKNVTMDSGLVTGVPKSPGQKYKHYSPKAKFIAFLGDDKINNMKDYFNKLVKNEKRIGIFTNCDDPNIDFYKKNKVYLNLLKTSDEIEYSRNYYSILRDFDRNNVDIILGIVPEKSEFSQAILNRVKKSTGGNIF